MGWRLWGSKPSGVYAGDNNGTNLLSGRSAFPEAVSGKLHSTFHSVARATALSSVTSGTFPLCRRIRNSQRGWWRPHLHPHPRGCPHHHGLRANSGDAGSAGTTRVRVPQSAALSVGVGRLRVAERSQIALVTTHRQAVSLQRRLITPSTASTTPRARRPGHEAAGARSVCARHRPTLPGSAQECPACVQGTLQHTASGAQKVEAHCVSLMHASPNARGVGVGVGVGVAVGVGTPSTVTVKMWVFGL